VSGSSFGNLDHPIGIASKTGIGRRIVHSFLQEGYCVGGIDNIELEPEEDLFKAMKMNQFVFTRANICSDVEVSDALQKILHQFGCDHVNALVNNAAISSPYLTATSQTSRISQWRDYINVNLTGAFIVTQLVFPHLVAGSAVVHISSTRAHQSESHCEGYAASKAGLLGLTHSQAISFGPQRIRVNCILPGWIDTGHYVASEADKEWHCVGRIGRPSDVSELCLFLCDSNRSGFITGQEFVVDGGVTKKMVYP
jgi:NAD(P)-dependent dehydrogenase (short-subunit alcohol dehydrogenase family)